MGGYVAPPELCEQLRELADNPQALEGLNARLRYRWLFMIDAFIAWLEKKQIEEL